MFGVVIVLNIYGVGSFRWSFSLYVITRVNKKSRLYTERIYEFITILR